MTLRQRRVRWLYLLVAAAAMGAVGSYQFVWSSIRTALESHLAMTEGSLGLVFSVYVIAQTVSQFPAGWFRDRYGPRIPLAVGAVLLTAGYLGTAHAGRPSHVLVWYTVGGLGAGTAFTVAVNTPVKWFDDRRGLATGLVTMAYGGVSALFIPSVRSRLATDFTGTLTVLAVVAGAVTLVGVFVLRDPPPEWGVTAETGTVEATDGSGDADQRGGDVAAHGWREAIRTWQFWLLYAVMIVVNGVGLMLIGNAVAFAEQFGLAAAVATATASAVAFGDSIGIVTVGGLSDRFDRGRTIAVTLTCSGLAMGLAVWAGATNQGLLFVALVGIAGFCRSPVFSIAPSLVGEYYGPARSSENYAALYTSKVWGGVGGGVVASALIAAVGWADAFAFGALALTVAGLLTTQLRPVDRAAE